MQIILSSFPPLAFTVLHPPSLVRTILLHPCLPRFALSSTFSSSDRKDFGFFEDIEISHPRTFVLDIANLCFIRAILDASADVVLDNHWLIHTLPEGDYLGVSLQEIHYVFRMPPPFFDEICIYFSVVPSQLPPNSFCVLSGFFSYFKSLG
nr:hypothetical protein Itr_chr04CG16940 [Ipomoea trifida]